MRKVAQEGCRGCRRSLSCAGCCLFCNVAQVGDGPRNRVGTGTPLPQGLSCATVGCANMGPAYRDSVTPIVHLLVAQSLHHLTDFNMQVGWAGGCLYFSA